MKLTQPPSSAHNTILTRDEGYKTFVTESIDSISPVDGYKYSEIYEVANSASFQSFERANVDRRTQMFVSGHVGQTEVQLLRYKKELLLHHSNKVMGEHNFEYFYDKALSPLLKWPGGKSEDLKHIKEDFWDYLPKNVDRYFEPFLGGGAVWLSMKAQKMYVNDLCSELISFYDLVQRQDAKFFSIIDCMEKNWELLASIIKDKHRHLYTSSDTNNEEFLRKNQELLEDNVFAPKYQKSYVNTLVSSLTSKLKNIRRVEIKKKVELSDEDLAQNIEGALKAGFYTFVRNVYNRHKNQDALKIACFYFLRDYCFSSMFRYNSKREFNVPYGGMSYNKRSPAVRVNYWKNTNLVSHLQLTTFCKEDFETFLRKNAPTKNDFIFVDPPYDSEFSTYAENTFGQSDQERLANYLVNKCDAKFMAIMKNTPFIRGLYEGKKSDVKCLTFDKTYSVSFKNRNDRAVEHLIVVRT